MGLVIPRHEAGKSVVVIYSIHCLVYISIKYLNFACVKIIAIVAAYYVEEHITIFKLFYVNY